jgi:hypothetical protein
LNTKVRPRRLFSQIELIAIDSMSLEATLANPLGMKFPTRDAPFSSIPIFTFIFDDCEANRFETFASVDIPSSNSDRLADAHYS